jgi:DNA polymerase-3 subunit beta
MKKLVSKLKVYRRLPICEGINVMNGVGHFTNLTTWLTFKTPISNGHYEISSYKKDVMVRTDIDFNEVPIMKDQSVTHTATITDKLLEVMTKAINYVGKDYLRPTMSGVYVNNKGICATDAHKLYWVDMDTNFPEVGVIIPVEFIKMLTSPIDVTIDAKFIRATYSDYTVQCYIIDGRYPNYKAVIPQNYNTTMVNRKELTKLINEIQHFSNKTTKQVRLRFTGVTLILDAEDLDRGVSKTSVIDTSKCDLIDVGINATFLLTALKTNKDEYVKFSLSDNQNRAIIIDDSILLMPLMLNR